MHHPFGGHQHIPDIHLVRHDFTVWQIGIGNAFGFSIPGKMLA